MYLSRIIVIVCIFFVVGAESQNTIINYYTYGFSSLNIIAGRYKFISYNQKSWFGALHACHAAGLKMAALQSQEDQESFHNLTLSLGIISWWWTAGNDLETKDSYFWVSNGQPFSYTNWDTGYPRNNVANRCVATPSAGFWINSNCNGKHYFICED